MSFGTCSAAGAEPARAAAAAGGAALLLARLTPAAALTPLCAAVQGVGAAAAVEAGEFSVKGKLGALALCATAYELLGAPGCCLVEFRRRRGDAPQFEAMLAALRERLAPVSAL